MLALSLSFQTHVDSRFTLHFRSGGLLGFVVVVVVVVVGSLNGHYRFTDVHFAGGKANKQI
jgi:hypothetical protein